MNNMKLDETILQSNTCLQLVEFIRRIKELSPESVEELNEDYGYIMRKTHKALKKRSRGYQVTDMFKGEELEYLDDMLKIEEKLKKKKGNYNV